MSTRPETAVDEYIKAREPEIRSSTKQSFGYRLGHLIRWCDEQGIEDVGELTREDLKDYRTWRREDGDLAPKSEETQMDTLKGFVEWCSNVGFTEEGIEEAVHSPDVSESDRRKTDIVETEKADQILKQLNRYSFASREHIIFLLLWETGARTGGLLTLDLEDYDGDSLWFEHAQNPGLLSRTVVLGKGLFRCPMTLAVFLMSISRTIVRTQQTFMVETLSSLHITDE